jgi:DnaK suppressor protein
VTKSERERYRGKLQALGRRIQDGAAGLAVEALQRGGGEANGDLSHAPLHLADLGTDHFNRELSVSFLETQNQTLAAIAAALQRIDAGTFGVCENCGRAIASERLAAAPYAPHCIDCAREAERDTAESA